jgi:hypothetical protein
MWQEEALSNCSSMKICTALYLSLLIFSDILRAVDTQNVLKKLTAIVALCKYKENNEAVRSQHLP